MKRWIVLSLLLVPLLAGAEGFWDGNAALQRGDASFESGLFAVSNSFPAGTRIAIQNQDTGKTVTATVTGRIEGQSDILVLISPKTAQALDLPQGTLGRVRVTVPPRADSSASTQTGDQTVSSDPDLNPAASYGTPNKAQVAEAPAAAPAPPAPSEEAPPAAASAAAAPLETAPAATPEAPTATPEVQAAAPEAPAVTPEAPATPNPDDAAIIAAAQSRVPQKQVFQPPREDEKFAYHPPAAVPPAAAATAAATPVETPQAATPPAATQEDLVQTDVTGPAAVPPAQSGGTQIALLPPEAPKPAQSAPAAIGPTSTTTANPPIAEPVQKAAPPVQKAAPAVQKATAPAQKAAPPVQTATSLPRAGAAGSYFLQLGAYGTEKVARDLAAKLVPTYPALVLAPSSGGTSVFRVVIGPLNRAESGTLLTWFRYRGFPDAFLKQE